MYCIYKIKIEGGKTYTGMTSSIKYRSEQHSSNLRGGRHPNKELQSDFNKVGKATIYTVCYARRVQMAMLMELVNVDELSYNKVKYDGSWNTQAEIEKTKRCDRMIKYREVFEREKTAA